MIKKWIFFLILLVQVPLVAQETIPQISLLTCDSGDQLYSTFGHSAIRIVDPVKKTDIIYNYGIFSFKQPNFYLKFLRGKLLYHLGKTSYKRFLGEYHYEKRGVEEQIFDLDSLDTYAFIEFLEENYKPENRSYKYDFFFDNCSTRIRDIFERQIGIEMPEDVDELTYRNQLDEELVPMVWSDFGIDLVIGAVADKNSNYRDQMFLPKYLLDQLGKAQINGRPLVKETRTVFSFSDTKAKRNKAPFITPFKILMGLLLVILLLSVLYRNKSSKILNVISFIWFLTLGLISLIMAFLWFGTDHLATKTNWNLLWCSPLFLLLVLKFRAIRSTSWLQAICKVIMAGSLICLLGWTLLPQQFHIAFIPMIIISMLLLARQLRNYTPV